MANTMAFIQAIKGQAIKDMNEHGILASLTIAQAILESGWGESKLSIKGNNLFGIKYSASRGGEKIPFPTIEYYNGKKVTIEAYFNSYSSWAESIADHTELLLNKRYSRIIGVTDYKQACKLIYECGYATDPNYSKQLNNIIEQYRLHELDIKYKIERLLIEMDIKVLQRWLNLNGFKGKDGKVLTVDGMMGTNTKFAKESVKTLLTYIMK